MDTDENTLPDDVSDEHFVEAQLGRPLLARPEVVVRCALGLPVVVRMPPVLPSGAPFPTRYWLTCPLAHRRIARLEAGGGVSAAERRLETDPAFRDAMLRAHARHAEERDRDVPEDALLRPRGGVGGVTSGVKCLHLHFADALATDDNPVGDAIRSDVLPLACETPCVRRAGAELARDPAWREPSRG